MTALKLWYTSTLFSFTPSKSLSRPSSLASTPSFSSFFPLPPSSLSSSNLFGCFKSSSLSFRTLCECTAVTGDTGLPENYVDAEGEDPGELDDEFDDEDYTIDVEAFEEEAKDVLREYSSSLSRELRLDDELTDQSETGRKKKKRKTTPRNVIPDHLLPKVAIVGRPNVGKSAMFNRLVGGNRAIVVDEPGVTRDRLYGRSFWGDNEFMVVDTGGVLSVSKTQNDVMEELAISTTIGMDGIPLASREAAVARMPSMIERQATAAVEEASVVIFLVDGQAGLTAADEEIADWLRRNYSDKFTILAVNKCESPRKGLMQASEFWSLGFTPLPVSALSGTGTGELLDLLCSRLQKVESSEDLHEEEDYIPAVAIVGRPNVGKSSILNALVGEDRTIVSPISGTTRDAIDTEFTGQDGQKLKVKERYTVSVMKKPKSKKQAGSRHAPGLEALILVPKFRLIDTAGIRRRAAVASSGSMTESLSVNRAFRAIRRSDVVALVIEALACITEQARKKKDKDSKDGKQEGRARLTVLEQNVNSLFKLHFVFLEELHWGSVNSTFKSNDLLFSFLLDIDCKIAERIEKEGKGCLIVVNKWDTIPNKNQQTAMYYEQDVREKLRCLDWAPIVYSTAIAGHSVDKIITAASAVEKERSRRLTTSILNQVVQEALAFKAPPRTRGGKRGRVYYCTQAAIRPPTFVFFVNDAKLFPETYRRYMEKQLRANAGFPGTPIRLLWRSRRKMEKGEVKGTTKTQVSLTQRDREVSFAV
uniref:GTPase Der n=1 Tax=Cucumis melo TaxID=3656 RepID=A0A9I9D8I7_CUCME